MGREAGVDETPDRPFRVLEGGYSLVPYAESDSGSDGCGNRLLHALDARRWVGDGDRTRDIQVHNLVSSWSPRTCGKWKRFAGYSMRLEVAR
jgi:hypothetical protein